MTEEGESGKCAINVFAYLYEARMIEAVILEPKVFFRSAFDLE
jgi:hypothetical protein